MNLPSNLFYPITGSLVVLSWGWILIEQTPASISLAFVMTLGVIYLGIDYLIRLSGFGSRIKSKVLLVLSAELLKIDKSLILKEKKRIEASLYSEYPKLLARIRFKKFEKYLEQKNDLKPIYKEVRLYSNRNKIYLIRNLVRISVNDRFLSEKEEQFIEKLVAHIGFPRKILIGILSLHNYVNEKDYKKEKQTNRQTFVLNQKQYSVLGLEASASLEEVKKAYRDLAKIYHPDMVKDKDMKAKSRLQFQLITEAYETIKNERG